jgi:hypothetical protein
MPPPEKQRRTVGIVLNFETDADTMHLTWICSIEAPTVGSEPRILAIGRGQSQADACANAIRGLANLLSG